MQSQIVNCLDNAPKILKMSSVLDGLYKKPKHSSGTFMSVDMLPSQIQYLIYKMNLSWLRWDIHDLIYRIPTSIKNSDVYEMAGPRVYKSYQQLDSIPFQAVIP